MQMEARFKTRISRMFKSSMNSCKPRNLSDIVENQVLSPQKQHSFHMMEPHAPKHQPQPRQFPSLCKPTCPDASEAIFNDHCIVSQSDHRPRRKVSERISPFALGVIDGRMCPPASPISPVSHFHKFHDHFGFRNEHARMKSRKKKKKKKSTRAMSKKIELCPFSSSSHSHNTNFSGWFSSEDDREYETDKLFSSRSYSSDSSEPRRRSPPRPKKKPSRQRKVKNSNKEMGVLPLEGKVKDSFAVVKRSSDPYNDFRTSMVEMIVEKQIFAAKDLEQLLQCFLSLNSDYYHRIIVEVFTEIYETLFSSLY